MKKKKEMRSKGFRGVVLVYLISYPKYMQYGNTSQRGAWRYCITLSFFFFERVKQIAPTIATIRIGPRGSVVWCGISRTIP